MPIDSTQLGRELARLRRGRAMLSPDLVRRLGPLTKRAFGIGDADSVPVIRDKAAATVKRLLRREAELQTAALAALGLLAETDQRRLTDRETWLANRLSYDVRTARRRVADAMTHLVDALVTDDHDRHRPEGPSDDGFTVRDFWATMRLDTPRPQLHEKRRVMVTADRLDAIVVRLTVPRAEPGVAKNDVDVRVDSGGELADVARPSPEDFEFTLRLPRRLHHGELHDYGLVFTVPAGQPMRPHYVFQPLVPCERFDLTVRFDPARLPEDIWLIDGVAPRVLDHAPRSIPLVPNATGVVRRQFSDLRQGLAYGIGWWPPVSG